MDIDLASLARQDGSVAKSKKTFAVHQEEERIEPPAEESRGMTEDPNSLYVTHPQEAVPGRKPKERGFAIFNDSVAEAAPLAKTQREPTVSKAKSRGFAIFEDDAPAQLPSKSKRAADVGLVEKFSRTMALNDENDENAPPSQEPQPQVSQPSQAEIAKRIRREERANRTRKIQVMDVKHIKNETKTIQLNLNSPTASVKVKRKKSVEKPVAEPTMTINTKEAMDEIYGIFNAPLASQAEEASQTEEDDDDSEDDYTTGDESTRTGQLSGPTSEYGDETRNDILGSQALTVKGDDEQAEETGWSDFETSKAAPDESDITTASTRDTDYDVYQDENGADGLMGEDVVTPQEENFRTHTVPIPDENYEPPSTQYRQQAVILPNHRLPFMTPIAEQTESSLGLTTARSKKDYLSSAKTPSRHTSRAIVDEEDDVPSSPFDEVTVELNDVKHKVLQPIRTKSTKGTISLGQGSAKNQIAAKVAPKTSTEVHKGPVILESQCNPMDPALRSTILSSIKPGLQSFEGYHEHNSCSGRTAEIKKYIKALARLLKSGTNVDKTASTLSLPPMLRLSGLDTTYTIKRELGAGTFAPVYLVENSAAVEEATNGHKPGGVGKLVHRKPLEAIKMEEPLSTWEFFILRQSHRRLGVSRATESIVRAHEMHLYRDECFLIEEYRSQGTLLDLVNLARADSTSSTGGGMEEVMAMWLTVELLRTVEALHAKQIIHGDLKGDNVLVRFDDPGVETDWSPTYFPSGAHGWASKGVCLIDFGRGIDMKQFVPNVAFIADWKTTEADCAEMRELRPWTYQIDYHGLAGIVHSLLFGKYMETIGEKGAGLGQGATKTYRIRESLKRYWQTDIWGEVFHLLLNPLAHLDGEEGKRMPVVRGMRGLRERMELWLEENCERGNGLKGMIGRMEKMIWEKRRKSVKG
jgi:checkpoint serine/threonine-protein kinase